MVKELGDAPPVTYRYHLLMATTDASHDDIVLGPSHDVLDPRTDHEQIWEKDLSPSATLFLPPRSAPSD